MSALLYGTLLAERMMSPPDEPPAVLTTQPSPHTSLEHPPANIGGAAPIPPADKGAAQALGGEHQSLMKINYWQDALAALVPAEVLAIHGIAVSVAAAARAPVPAWIFVILFLLTVGLSLGATIKRSVTVLPKNPATYAGALIAGTAFVFWAMLQPSSAFDSLGLDISPLNRTLIPVIGAVILGLAAGLLAWRQQLKTGATSAPPSDPAARVTDPTRFPPTRHETSRHPHLAPAPDTAPTTPTQEQP